MGKIIIDGPDDYETAVESVIETIRKNEVGRVIVDGIEGTNKDLRIVPFSRGDAAVHGECNAMAHPDSARDSAPKGISGPTGWYAGDSDNPRTSPEDERYNPQRPWNLKGTGAGSDVHIYFSPASGSGTSACSSGVYGTLPDEFLLHEMVHALRDMQGKSNQIPTEGTARKYDNEEEFLAIVVTNVYMSANNKTQLRADHSGHRQLQPPLNTSSGFLKDAYNYKLMNIYNLIWKPQFWLLSIVPISAKFNPFRELTLQLNA